MPGICLQLLPTAACHTHFGGQPTTTHSPASTPPHSSSSSFLYPPPPLPLLHSLCPSLSFHSLFSPVSVSFKMFLLTSLSLLGVLTSNVTKSSERRGVLTDSFISQGSVCLLIPAVAGRITGKRFPHQHVGNFTKDPRDTRDHFSVTGRNHTYVTQSLHTPR